MPRFHFNVRDGENVVRDEIGSSLPDIETARQEARDRYRALLSSRELDHVQAKTVEIADTVGRVIDTVTSREIDVIKRV